MLLLRHACILNAAQTWTAVGGFFRSVVVTVSWLCPMVCSTQSPLPPGRVEVGVEVEYPLPVGPVLVNSWSPKPLELKLSNYLVLEQPLPPLNSASTMLKRWRIRQTLIDQGLQHDVTEEILALCPIPILHERKRSWGKRVAIFREELRKNL